MAYAKMTVADFKDRLKNGDYQDATGARRAAGKADLTDSEKDQCRKLIDKHFGVEAGAAPKKAVTKKAKGVSKKAVAKKAAASNGKAEHKSNGVAAAPAATGKKGKGGRKRRSAATASEPDESGLLAGLHLAKERIGTIAQAVETMRHCKAAYSELDTQKGMTVAANTLTEIMQGVHDSLKAPLDLPAITEADPQVVETLARTAAAAVGLPGQESPVVAPPAPPEYQHPVS